MNSASDPVTPSKSRASAEQRRAHILATAIAEFAEHGLRGASIEAVAARVGVSQPYVYKLFGTKQDLFLACLELVRERVQQAFAAAAAAEPDDALGAMRRAYTRGLVGRDEGRLLLQGFAAADAPAVREAVGMGYAALWHFVARTTGAAPEDIFSFFAAGMLLTVDAAVGFLDRVNAPA